MFVKLYVRPNIVSVTAYMTRDRENRHQSFETVERYHNVAHNRYKLNTSKE